MSRLRIALGLAALVAIGAGAGAAGTYAWHARRGGAGTEAWRAEAMARLRHTLRPTPEQERAYAPLVAAAAEEHARLRSELEARSAEILRRLQGEMEPGLDAEQRAALARLIARTLERR